MFFTLSCKRFFIILTFVSVLPNLAHWPWTALAPPGTRWIARTSAVARSMLTVVFSIWHKSSRRFPVFSLHFWKLNIIFLWILLVLVSQRKWVLWCILNVLQTVRHASQLSCLVAELFQKSVKVKIETLTVRNVFNLALIFICFGFNFCSNSSLTAVLISSIVFSLISLRNEVLTSVIHSSLVSVFHFF